MSPSDLLTSAAPSALPDSVSPFGKHHPLAPMAPYPSHNLPTEDGEPLETQWHAFQIPLLIDIVNWHRRDRKDFHVAGNGFVYFSPDQVRNRDYRGPDFYLVNNAVWWPARPCWVVWQENGKFPDLIVELLSPSTRQTDLETKFEIYETIFDTPEYVAYDPDTKELLAWRKVEGKFQPIPPDRFGNYPLVSAELAIGKWEGLWCRCDATWVRFFDHDGNVVPTSEEAARARADAETDRANRAKRQAGAEKARADDALRLADSEKARADALAAEVARLKAQLQNPK